MSSPSTTPALLPSSPLPPNVVRSLNDKLYDRRKQAALEIERLVREAISRDDEASVRQIVHSLIHDFAYSMNAYARMGGLIGLAAVAIALGADVHSHLSDIMPPVLACLIDQESRVRYYALESMYNTCKVARASSLAYFNEIFDALSKLAADPESSVKNGADLLDRLIKDIISEQSLQESISNNDGTNETSPIDDPLRGEFKHFSLRRFIPLLAERIYTMNPYSRSFLVSWISVLDAIPELELITYLPDFLDGLLTYLSDPNADVRVATTNILGEFLKELCEIGSISHDISAHIDVGLKSIPPSSIAFGRMYPILLHHLSANSTSQFKFEIQLTCLNWIIEFLHLAPVSESIRVIPSLVRAVLPVCASGSDEVKRTARECEKELLSLVDRLSEHGQKAITSTSQKENEKAKESEIATTNGNEDDDNVNLDYEATVQSLTLLFLDEHEQTRLASLEWLISLQRHAPEKILQDNDGIFSILLKILSDPSEQVVKRDLQLFGHLCTSSPSSPTFQHTVTSLLKLFQSDKILLSTRGSFIIRHLCTVLPPDRIFRAVAEILDELFSSDVQFCSTMVTKLNLLLVSSDELIHVRESLRDPQSMDTGLFMILFRSWSHNPMATLCLCLLAQSYELATHVLTAFIDIELNVTFLTQMDKLVQLIESPTFAYLRLQLLDPTLHPFLYKCMYGILMLLPQSSAFVTLRNRLTSVIQYSSLSIPPSPSYRPQTRVDSVSDRTSKEGKDESGRGLSRDDMEMLLEHFKSVQKRHTKYLVMKSEEAKGSEGSLKVVGETLATTTTATSTVTRQISQSSSQMGGSRASAGRKMSLMNKLRK